ncbi:MAG: hypothetical protein J5J00_15730 [Deltaproteobacteria bacterium]|nr:hypothetical protein [Deltaproteobacteria bacterium]
MAKNLFRPARVIVLTLAATLLTTGCSYVRSRYGEQCNSRAYLNSSLADFINSRFHSNSQVRMAVIPFSTEANLSPRGSEFPGLGDQLAWKVHAELLQAEAMPIIEVFNRQDWPGKKEEFFTGNFGALSMAREAGYDLVLVGLVERQKGIQSMSAFTKVMDVDSGITVWYGKTTASSNQRTMDRVEDFFWLKDRDPSELYLDELIGKTAKCIVKAATAEPEV